MVGLLPRGKQNEKRQKESVQSSPTAKVKPKK